MQYVHNISFCCQLALFCNCCRIFLLFFFFLFFVLLSDTFHFSVKQARIDLSLEFKSQLSVAQSIKAQHPMSYSQSVLVYVVCMEQLTFYVVRVIAFTLVSSLRVREENYMSFEVFSKQSYLINTSLGWASRSQKSFSSSQFFLYSHTCKLPMEAHA